MRTVISYDENEMLAVAEMVAAFNIYEPKVESVLQSLRNSLELIARENEPSYVATLGYIIVVEGCDVLNENTRKLFVKFYFSAQVFAQSNLPELSDYNFTVAIFGEELDPEIPYGMISDEI